MLISRFKLQGLASNFRQVFSPEVMYETLILLPVSSGAARSILPQTPNATRNGAKFDRNIFRRKSLDDIGWSTTVNKTLQPLISFFRLWFTELCSDWSKRYFHDFRAF